MHEGLACPSCPHTLPLLPEQPPSQPGLWPRPTLQGSCPPSVTTCWALGTRGWERAASRLLGAHGDVLWGTDLTFSLLSVL